MALDYKRLIRFDLVEKIEEALFSDKNNMALISDFLGTMQELWSSDRFIRDLPSYPRSTDKIIRSELLSAIGATLSIEGTQVNVDEMEESFQKASLNENLARKEQEAENSRKVYQFIIELVDGHEEDFSFSEQMIKHIHKLFTDNMNYLSNEPGKYRGDFCPTFGHPRKKSLCRNKGEVTESMAGFVEWLNKKGESFLSSNVIIKAIMAHYYLAEIHPFGDGNGRTARALEALVLYESGINRYCFWSLANFWSMHRDEYLIHLDNIRRTCDPWNFLIWGIKGYLGEINRIKGLVLKKVKQLMYMDYVKYLLYNSKDVKINKRILEFLRLLVHMGRISQRKFLSLPQIKLLYSSVKPVTQRRDFHKMTDLKLVVVTEEENNTIIEANYQILEFLNYNV